MGIRRFRLKLNCVSIAQVFSASSFRSKSSSTSIKYGDASEFPSISLEDSSCEDNGNKIMVVVNSTFEAKCALDWALSHAVQSQDTVLLVHVLKPSSSQGTECGKELNPKTYQLVLDMKNMCQMKRPGVQVKVVKVEGEEQGRTIVEEAKQQSVSLLVIGQRKRSLWRGLVRRLWAGNNKRAASNGVADYCIQNASCMTIAVRRKNRKLGGYLITTKRHKKFWLLA
ncbi:universal stress protein PHOS32-like [Prosopis cineraria]|uniref:universal stress protein PHOS32-like n=1 Tax=Prosopis cineraria TaxID=364024 RepID=UPI00240ED686|nr:universal stress protein PHOS32-like [Prosopis cineraria]